MARIEPKFLTLKELRDSPSTEVWVINRSDQRAPHASWHQPKPNSEKAASIFDSVEMDPNTNQPKVYHAPQMLAAINFQVNLPNNEIVELQIPPTWLPINLTSFCDKGPLLSSQRFMQMLREGMIGAITEEDADRILRQSDAKAERTKWKVLGGTGVNVAAQAAEQKPSNAQAWVVEATNRTDMNESERRAVFQANAHTLTEGDVKYALQKLETGEAAEFLRRRLGELQGA